MNKISISGIEARNRVIKGADYVANAVKATLGAYGTNALLEKGNRPTNDGYTISAELAPTVEDEFERRGALALHEASAKTNDEVGDATSSAQALAQAILKEASRLLGDEKTLVAKCKPSEVLEKIETSKNNVIEKLKEKVKQIETEEELIQSAKVAVENDDLAKLIGSTQWQIGKNGFILSEDTIDIHSSVDIVKGIRLDNGFGASVVINNEKDQSLEVKDTAILLTNYTIDVTEIQSFKDKIITPLITNKQLALVIIARAFTANAIQLCVDTAKSGFMLYPINAPYTDQTQIMKDLAAVTGATYYDQEEKRLEDISIEDIGYSSKLVARRWDAIVTGKETEKTKQSVEKRITQLKEKLTGNISDFERKNIQQRIAQFEGGFAILKVGAETPFQRKYLKDKADDAVNSVRLALQGGTIRGAGIAFKEISDELSDDDILKRPLLAIYNQIILSSPKDYVIPEWVRDPYLTLVSALKNACSVAGSLATINTIITTKDKKECSQSHEHQD